MTLLAGARITVYIKWIFECFGGVLNASLVRIMYDIGQELRSHMFITLH